MKKLVNEEKALKIFKALGDETRWKIVNEIIEQPKAVTVIATKTGLTQPATSHQLQVLKLYNIVKCERKGKEIYYSLADSHVKNIVELVITHISHE